MSEAETKILPCAVPLKPKSRIRVFDKGPRYGFGPGSMKDRHENFLELSSKFQAGKAIDVENRKSDLERKEHENDVLENVPALAEQACDSQMPEKERESALKELDKYSGSYLARKLFEKALIAKDVDVETWAEMIAESKKLGMDGESIGHANALRCRQHVTDTIEKVHGLEDKETGGDVNFNIVFINNDGSTSQPNPDPIDVCSIPGTAGSD